MKRNLPISRRKFSRCSWSNGTQLKYPSFTENVYIEKTVQLLMGVDKKSQMNLVESRHDLMLIMFLKKNEHKRVYSIILKSPLEEQRLKHLFDHPSCFLNPEVQKYYKDAAKLKTEPVCTEDRIAFRVVQPNHNKPVDFTCAFRICPICFTLGSVHNVFAHYWWKDENLKPYKENSSTPPPPPTIFVKQLLEKIKKEDPKFSKFLDKVEAKNIWKEIMVRLGQIEDKVSFLIYPISFKICYFFFDNRRKTSA